MPAQIIAHDGEVLRQMRQQKAPCIARGTDPMHEDERRAIALN
ncbi:MAG: hypothetical protein AAFN44_17195 [Pseudomonadota bacterium]